MTRGDTTQRAVEALTVAGISVAEAQRTLAALEAAGLSLAYAEHNELVVRWIDASQRPVPPEADTIIRTITRTVDGQSWSTTHWLEGLASPKQSR